MIWRKTKERVGKDVEVMLFETHFTVETEPSAFGWAGTWVLKEDRNNSK